MISISKTVYDIQQIGTGDPVVINNYVLLTIKLIWESDSTIYRFDCLSKAVNDNLLNSSTFKTWYFYGVLLKIDALYSLENCLQSVY